MPTTGLIDREEAGLVLAKIHNGQYATERLLVWWLENDRKIQQRETDYRETILDKVKDNLGESTFDLEVISCRENFPAIDNLKRSRNVRASAWVRSDKWASPEYRAVIMGETNKRSSAIVKHGLLSGRLLSQQLFGPWWSDFRVGFLGGLSSQMQSIDERLVRSGVRKQELFDLAYYLRKAIKLEHLLVATEALAESLRLFSLAKFSDSIRELHNLYRLVRTPVPAF